MSLALIVKTDGDEGRDNFGLLSKNTGVTQNELEDGSFSLGTVDVMLDVEGSNLVRRWETFDLTIG